MKRWAMLVLLAGCKKEGGGDLLGTLVFESGSPLGIGATSVKEGLMLVFEEKDLDAWHAGVVDHDGFIELPAPPLQPDDFFALGRAMTAEAAIGIVRGAEVEVTVLDGGVWETLPTPILDASGLQLGEVLEHDGSVYVTVGGHLLVWDGAAWADRVQGSSVILGGFSGAVQWAVVSEGADFSLVRIDGESTGEPIYGGQGKPSPSAVNGDAERFQVFLDGTMCVFDGTVLTAVESASNSPYAAPGSERVIAGTGEASSVWEMYEDGASVGVALLPFASQVEDDVLDYIALRPSLDATEMAMVIVDEEEDGGIGLRVRFLELPFEGDPFAP